MGRKYTPHLQKSCRSAAQKAQLAAARQLVQDDKENHVHVINRVPLDSSGIEVQRRELLIKHGEERVAVVRQKAEDRAAKVLKGHGLDVT